MFALGHVAKAEDVELLGAISSCGVDREENGPGNATTDKADDDGNAKIAQEEVSIQGIVLQHVGVR